MIKKQIGPLGVIIFFIGSLLAGCDTQPPVIHQLTGYAQGTTYHISWWSEKPTDTQKIQQAFSKTLDQIDKEFSTYRDDSYISQFNQSLSTDWQPASADFIQLVNIAKTVNQETKGCYDPTIGPLFSLWGFKADVLHVPSAQQIAEVQAQVGINHLETDTAQQRIRKTIPQLQVSFSSMSEGYTIGKLSKVLEAHDVQNYLVEFGGDMKIQGHKPGGQHWRVAIERPIRDEARQEPYRILTITDEQGVTLDTSGTYHHSFDANGKQYSHIINPRTGAPITHNLVSTTVLGHDPRVSDAWATAMMCLGPDEGKEIATAKQLEAFFIWQQDDTLASNKSPALAASKRVEFDQ